MNMNSCPIKILTVLWPPFIIPPENNSQKITKGIEINIISTVAKQTNFLPIYIVTKHEPENWGALNVVNRSGTGMMGSLLENKGDIAIGNISPNTERHYLFDFTVQYMQDATIWVVPVSQALPNWKKIFQIFTPIVWVMTLFTYISVTIMTIVLSRGERLNNFRAASKVFLFTYCTMIGNSMGVLPVTTKLRLFIFLNCLYSMHWTTAYSSSLTSMMTSPKYGVQIKSFDDVLKFNLDYGMTLSTVPLFEKFSDKIEDKIALTILKNYKLCMSASECLEKVADRYYRFVC